MAKLIYSAITSLDGYVADKGAISTGPRQTRRRMPLLTASSGQSAPISTGDGCMR